MLDGDGHSDSDFGRGYLRWDADAVAGRRAQDKIHNAGSEMWTHVEDRDDFPLDAILQLTPGVVVLQDYALDAGSNGVVYVLRLVKRK